MRTVNIHAAKTQLSRLVDAAAAGEEIIIAKSGKPVARLGPLVGPRRRLGMLARKLRSGIRHGCLYCSSEPPVRRNRSRSQPAQKAGSVNATQPLSAIRS